MFFQQQMRLPIDSEILQSPTSDDEQDSNIDEMVTKLLTSREQAFEKAKQNIDKAQKNQKETYDRKHLPEELPVGTEVLLENTAQQQRKGGKMDPVWLGPYTISKSMGKGVYELKNSDGEVLKKKANINWLKKFNRRQPQRAKRVNPDSQGSSPPAKKRKTDPDWTHICNGCCLTMEDKDALLTGKW